MDVNTIWRCAPCLFWAQGVFYFATGTWPLVHRESFEAVTGHKTDYWLVVMVAALTLALALSFLESAWKRRNNTLLPGLAALAFCSVDVYYVCQDEIRPVYLTDAAAEFLFFIWAICCGTASGRHLRGAGPDKRQTDYV